MDCHQTWRHVVWSLFYQTAPQQVGILICAARVVPYPCLVGTAECRALPVGGEQKPKYVGVSEAHDDDGASVALHTVGRHRWWQHGVLIERALFVGRCGASRVPFSARGFSLHAAPLYSRCATHCVSFLSLWLSRDFGRRRPLRTLTATEPHLVAATLCPSPDTRHARHSPATLPRARCAENRKTLTTSMPLSVNFALVLIWRDKLGIVCSITGGNMPQHPWHGSSGGGDTEPRPTALRTA